MATDKTEHNPRGVSAAFEQESINRLLLRFAGPAIISMLVNSIYNIVDQIFIGWGVGYLGNAATSVCFPFVTVMLALSLMVGDGGVACFSLLLGGRKLRSAQKAAGNAIFLSLVVGALLIICGELLMDRLLPLFGATEANYAYSESYGRITLAGMIFVTVSMAASGLIRADGHPRYAMLCMIVGAVLNTVLDALFVLVFHWGVAGAAWATVIGQAANFILAVLYLPRLKAISFSLALLKPELRIIRRIVILGMSSLLTQGAGTVLVIVMNNLLVYYGALSIYGPDIPMAAFGIVMKVNQLLMGILIGLGVGAQPIVGYNYGARNYARVRSTYLRSVLAATVAAVLGWLIFQTCTQGIVHLFGQESALYNHFALRCFRIFLAAVFLSGFTVVSGGFFQAVGKPVRAMLVSLSRFVLFQLPAALILTGVYGLTGALYAGMCGDILSFLFASVFVVCELRLLKRQIKNAAVLQPRPEEG